MYGKQWNEYSFVRVISCLSYIFICKFSSHRFQASFCESFSFITFNHFSVFFLIKRNIGSEVEFQFNRTIIDSIIDLNFRNIT